MDRARMTVADALRETWFWSEIFRDHATFIHGNLSPGEEQQVRWADAFKLSFDRLSSETREVARTAGIAAPAGAYALTGVPAEDPMAGLSGQELAQYEQRAMRLSRNLLESINSLRGFKEQLLQKKLDCQVQMALGPSLISHMIIESEEAHRVMSRVRESAPLPLPLEALHHHLVWLPDAAGHAAVLCSGLDGPEKELRNQVKDFHDRFDSLHLKALELYNMLRATPRMVGALRQLNRDAMTSIAAFRTFLASLREQMEGCAIMTTNAAPGLADHMLREELYYTEKLLALQPEEAPPGAEMSEH